MAKIEHIMTFDDQMLASGDFSSGFFFLKSCYKPDGLFKKKINVEIRGYKFKDYWVLTDKIYYENSHINDVRVRDISNIYENIGREGALRKAKERLDTLLNILVHKGESSLVRFIFDEYDERKNIVI